MPPPTVTNGMSTMGMPARGDHARRSSVGGDQLRGEVAAPRGRVDGVVGRRGGPREGDGVLARGGHRRSFLVARRAGENPRSRSGAGRGRPAPCLPRGRARAGQGPRSSLTRYPDCACPLVGRTRVPSYGGRYRRIIGSLRHLLEGCAVTGRPPSRGAGVTLRIVLLGEQSIVDDATGAARSRSARTLALVAFLVAARRVAAAPAADRGAVLAGLDRRAGADQPAPRAAPPARTCWADEPCAAS